MQVDNGANICVFVGRGEDRPDFCATRTVLVDKFNSSGLMEGE